MGFPDRIERTVEIAHPPAKVWAALTTAEGLGTWFGEAATIDLRPGGAAEMTWTAARRRRCASNASRSRRSSASPGASTACPTTIRATPTSSSRSSRPPTGTRLTVVESGFAQLPEDAYRNGLRRQHRGLGQRAGGAGRVPRCQRGLTSRPSPRRSSPPWPTRAGGRSWPQLAAGGPATATDLATRLPITRQAIAKHLALLAEAGLVAAEPGERRRVRYRLRSAPMQVAQQFLAALARDWDRQLDALQDHLDAVASAEPTRTERSKGTSHD